MKNDKKLAEAQKDLDRRFNNDVRTFFFKPKKLILLQDSK